jgi:hypothetical protein
MNNGDIIRFQQWHLLPNSRRPMLRKNEHLWGVVEENDRFRPLWPKWLVVRVTERGECEAPNWEFDAGDAYEVIPPDDVPGEVYAALARLALMGELEGEY